MLKLQTFPNIYLKPGEPNKKHETARERGKVERTGRGNKGKPSNTFFSGTMAQQWENSNPPIAFWHQAAKVLHCLHFPHGRRQEKTTPSTLFRHSGPKVLHCLQLPHGLKQESATPPTRFRHRAAKVLYCLHFPHVLRQENATPPTVFRRNGTKVLYCWHF